MAVLSKMTSMSPFYSSHLSLLAEEKRQETIETFWDLDEDLARLCREVESFLGEARRPEHEIFIPPKMWTASWRKSLKAMGETEWGQCHFDPFTETMIPNTRSISAPIYTMKALLEHVNSDSTVEDLERVHAAMDTVMVVSHRKHQESMRCRSPESLKKRIKRSRKEFGDLRAVERPGTETTDVVASTSILTDHNSRDQTDSHGDSHHPSGSTLNPASSTDVDDVIHRAERLQQMMSMFASGSRD